MKRIAIVGAGKIGQTIADMLGSSGDYRAVTVADRSEAQLAGIRPSARFRPARSISPTSEARPPCSKAVSPC